jgi:hypothetical protein
MQHHGKWCSGSLNTCIQEVTRRTDTVHVLLPCQVHIHGRT